MVRHMVLWSGISVIPHSRQVCWFSLMYISASRYVRPYRSFTSSAMSLLVGSNGGLPVRFLRHVGGAFPRICLTVERNSRRVIPSMVNSPSQPFRTKHLIWFRDRAAFSADLGRFVEYFLGTSGIFAFRIGGIMLSLPAPQSFSQMVQARRTLEDAALQCTKCRTERGRIGLGDIS